MIMKYQHFILAAFFLSGITSCNSSTKPGETKESTPVATITEDSTATETTTPAENAEVNEQETQAQKTFLETFYDGLDENFEPDYVSKFITPNAKQILIDFIFSVEFRKTSTGYDVKWTYLNEYTEV